MFETFTSTYESCIETVQADLAEYRALSDPETGAEKVALWPKTYSSRELERMRKAEEEKMAREEAAEEERRRLEEEKEAAAAPAKKGAPAKKAPAADKRQPSRGGVSSAQSGRSAK